MFSEDDLIGRGMEGSVYEFGPGTVAKVWHTRSPAQLATLNGFYAELSALGLPFGTPEILEITTWQGHAVTVERRWEGVTLQEAIEDEEIEMAAAVECVAGVLAELARTTAGPHARAVGVLGEAAPPWHGHADWGAALAALVARRSAGSAALLTAAVPDLDKKIIGLYEHLAALPPTTALPVCHGDLFPENILLDGDGAVTAVLDWGFLSTAADPAFDASISAAIFDMYGVEARERDDELTDVLCRAGHDRHRLLTYRAAYALATATVYDPAGQDGHFAWCAGQLNRDDVTAVLLS